jgi:antirestriction protein
MTTTTTSPRLYVGTYAKYNSGSIKGAWLDLEDFADREDFLEACKKLHADEADPEFMFQDFEGFPRSLYSESSVSDDLFAWIALDSDDRELLEVYRDNIGDGDIEVAREKFAGKYDSAIEWAEQFIDDTGALNDCPETLKQYFDYEAYARDARLSGDMSFIEHDGSVWVFYG